MYMEFYTMELVNLEFRIMCGDSQKIILEAEEQLLLIVDGRAAAEGQAVTRKGHWPGT